MSELTVVTPIYGCRDNLTALYERLVQSVIKITEDFEIIFVDDCSPDDSWEVLEHFAKHDSRVVAIRLSRNFGQDAAITAGLSRSSGAWTIVMDCDLQEPPEEIPRLYAEAQKGFDIVKTVRLHRRHAWPRRFGARIFRYLLLESGRGRQLSTLSLLSRRVVDAFLTVQDRDREYVLILDWLGFSSSTLEFAHVERPVGKSSYTWRRLVRVALGGMFFSTTVLLRWIVLIGFLIAIAGFGLALFDIVYYFTGNSPSGYTSLAVLLLVLVGFIIISLGVVGLYVGRIFDQVKGRPLFIIDRAVYGRDYSVGDTSSESAGTRRKGEEVVP